MGRPKKVITETKADVLDKLLKEIDPEIILAGALGAVAAGGGITPPFTRLLMGIDSTIGGDLGVAQEAAKTWYDVAKWGSPLLFVLGLGGNKDYAPSTTEVQMQASARALMASGALEAMLMMSFAKNPSAMEALGKGISGITSIKLPI